MLQIASLSWRPNSKTKQVLHDISIEIREGDLVVLIGANGSGKSSLLRNLSGWLRPSQGDVLLNAQPVYQLSPKNRAEWIAMLPQKMKLAESISVSEWLCYARFRFSESYHARRKKISALLEKQGLSHLGERFFSQLSGGEAQRICLLSLIAQESKIWLLDEPANHLDPKIQLEIYQRIISQWQTGTTIVLITHNINLLLRSVSFSKQERIRVIGIQEGSIAFEEALSSPLLVQKISQLYQLPAQMIEAFGFSQLIFGSNE